MLKSIVRTLRVAQFIVALVVFTFIALMPATMVSATSSDKLMHFLGNFLLLMSAWLACFGRWNIGLVLALLVPYSLVIELAQWFAPSRMVDGQDMVANLLGLATGAAVAFVADRQLQRMPRLRSYLTKH